MSQLPFPSPTAPPSTPPASTGNPVLWGNYLAMSWTWIIGMVLPVLIVRDYGVWAWVVFAVPNVIGAGAMGSVLRDLAASRAMVARHLPMMAMFSLVTVAFHLFVAGWIVTQLMGPWALAAVIGVSALLYLLGGPRRGSADPLVALLVLVVSLSAGATMILRGDVPSIPQVNPLPLGDLLALSAVCVLGFALCPYLDLTFHRARQATSPAGGRAAFALGFGLFFLSMIVLTLLYSGAVPTRPGTGIAQVLAVHLVIQSGFTVAVHLRALHDVTPALPSLRMATPAVLCFALAVALFFPFDAAPYNGMSRGEIGYRLFMSFYGLVFPAYAWIAMTPLHDPDRRPRPAWREWVALVAVLVLATPFYYLAFIERQMHWVVIGVAIVLLGRLAAWRRPAANVRGKRVAGS